MKLKTLFITIFIVGVYSCSQKDQIDCSNRVIEVKHLETEYGCTNVDINLSDAYMIIRNASDYSQYVIANCQTNIDFNTYDLVIGKKGLPNGLDTIKYKLVENCETCNQNLKITFDLSDTTEAPNVTYNALIPKLEENQDFNVEIIVNQP